MKPRMLLVACLCLSAPWAPAPARAADAGDLHARITDAYMSGKFDDLDQALGEASKRTAVLTPEQKADVKYVREALTECRPAWWAQCKQGKPVRIRQEVLGQRLEAFYDPKGKPGVQMNSGLGGMRITVSWVPEEMDSTEKGMYGYLQGDQTCVNVWSNLSMAGIYTRTPMQTLARMNDRDKLRLNRYMSFRSNLATLSHSTPPGRRYALHIYFAAFYYDNWGKGPIAGARRAACSMVMAEVLKDPALYPSLKLPGRLPEQNAEEALGKHYKMSIKRGSAWTIAEDRRFREAIKPFAAANDKTAFQTEKVTLPNKLVVAIDPNADAALRPQRDAWFKQQFDKVTGGK